FTDRFGRCPVYALGAALMFVWGFVAFPLFNTENDFVILLAIIAGLLVQGLMYAGQPAIMAEMFPTRMRYSGVSLGYQVTSIVAGSMAPIIAVRLLDTFDSSVPIAWYLAGACALTAAAGIVARETSGPELAEIDSADEA